jgi:hypothetical protein
MGLRITLLAHRLRLASALLAIAASVACSNALAQTWEQLTPDEQRVLEPLKDDWPNIEPARRKKWLEITKRYNRMSPEQQDRLQTRMRQWAALSPAERKQVRERYKKLQDMPPERREEIIRKWREYDSLTDQEKDTLRQAHPNPPQRSGTTR